MLEFNVSHQNIIRQDSFNVVSGSQNYLTATFNFITDDWDDISVITAVFARKNGQTYNVVLDENNECLVPWEVIEFAGSFTVSVYGGDLITTDTNEIKVKKSGFDIGEQPSEPSPSVYNQIVKLVQNAVDVAQSVRQDADSGLFDGNGISETRLNDDYTLTFEFTDGSVWTSSSIRGEQGNSIVGVELNDDYTLTLTFSDGSVWTSSSIRGEKGNGISDITLNEDYSLTITFDDGNTWTSDSIRGESGNGISNTVLNEDYTLTINYTDGTSWTSSSIRGEKGDKPVKGVDYFTQEDIDSIINPIISGKQDKLVEGNNITIDPTTNVISANWNTNDYYTKEETDAELVKKQNILTAGENIHIDENGVISADGGDLSNYYTKDEVNTELAKKQDELTQGNNIVISDDNVISADLSNYYDKDAVDNKLNDKQNVLTQGDNITIDTNNKISAIVDLSDYYNKSTIDSKLSEKQGTLKQGNNITIGEDNTISAIVNLSDYYNKSTIDDKLDDKQDKLTQGTNVNISDDGVISATDTKYTAGEGIHISENNEISADLSSVYRACGSVATYDDLPTENVRTGDVYDVLDTDMNYVAIVDESGNITWDALSGTTDLSNYYTKTETDGLLNAKQNILTQAANAGKNITIADGKISAADGAAVSVDEIKHQLVVDNHVPVDPNKIVIYYTDNNTYDFSHSLELTKNCTNITVFSYSSYGYLYRADKTGSLSISTNNSRIYYFVNTAGTYTRFYPKFDGNYRKKYMSSSTSTNLTDWTALENGVDGNYNNTLCFFDGTNVIIGVGTEGFGSDITAKLYSGPTSDASASKLKTGVYSPLRGSSKDAIDTFWVDNNTYPIKDSKARTDIASINTSISNKQDKLSDAQISATNSGITAEKVAIYDGYADVKQDKLVQGSNITIDGNTISAIDTKYTAGKNITITGTTIAAADGSALSYDSTSKAVVIDNHLQPKTTFKLFYTDNNVYDFSKYVDIIKNTTDAIIYYPAPSSGTYVYKTNSATMPTSLSNTANRAYYFSNKNNQYIRIVITPGNQSFTTTYYISSDLKNWTAFMSGYAATSLNDYFGYLYDGLNLLVGAAKSERSEARFRGIGVDSRASANFLSDNRFAYQESVGYKDRVEQFFIDGDNYEIVDKRARTDKQDVLTTAQLSAVNSGITSSKVVTYDEYATTKQNVLTEGDNITIADNVISAIVPTRVSELENDSKYALQSEVDKKLDMTVTSTQTIKGPLYIGDKNSTFGNAVTNMRKLSGTTVTGKALNGAAFAVGTSGEATFQQKTYNNDGTGARNEAVLRFWNGHLQFASNSTTTSMPAESDYKEIATQEYVNNGVESKQDTLVSGTNIKTINGQSVLGDGNLTIKTSSNVFVTQGDYEKIAEKDLETIYYIFVDV